jgi:3-polyprenyl-4-hydroxybenzoate decarboxylase
MRSSRRPSPKFYYKQKVVEEMSLVADNIHDKFQTSLRQIARWSRTARRLRCRR